MTKITFYAADTPNSEKVSIALMEMRLPFDIISVDLERGEQRTPEFMQLSPNGKTPAIVDPIGRGDMPVTLFESAAIVVYLAEKTGMFLPAEPTRRASVLAWTFWQMANLGPVAGQAWHFARRRHEEAYATQRFIAEGRRLWRVMESRLAASPYLGDAEFSIADIVTLPWANASRRLFGARWIDHPNVRRWRDACAARQGVREGLRVLRASTACAAA